MTGQTIDALITELGVDPWSLTITPDLPAPPRPCGHCRTPVDVRVSTGTRWVCLDCALTLTDAA